MRPDRKSLLIPFLLLAACSTQADATDGDYAQPAVPLAASSAGSDAPMETMAPASAGDMAYDQEPTDPNSVAAQIEARNQKQQVLAKTYVDMGDNAFERGDFVGAAAYYADALRLDPSSREARDGARRSQAAGAGEGWDVDSAEDVLGAAQARATANRTRIDGLVRDGDWAMSEGDFDTAVTKFTAATQALRYSPELASGNLDLSLVESRLEQAIAARNSAEDSQRSLEAAAAEAEAQAAVQAREAYFNNLVATHLDEADQQFRNGFPGEAVQTLDRLLRIDPDNQEASKLREIANEAWHQNRQRNAGAAFREEWQRTFEELRHITAPPAKLIDIDPDHWAAISNRKPLDRAAEIEDIDPIEAGIRETLATTRIKPNFEDVLLEEIVPNLSTYTNVNFVISRAVRDDIDEDTKTIRLSMKEALPVDRILAILTDLTGGEVRFVIRHGAVNVVTAEEADTDSITRQYEVRDIVRPVKDFPLQEYNLSPSGGIDADDEELPETEATILTEDELLTIIQESIEADSWDGETHSANIENGTLIVHHSPAVQAEIAQMLEDLRVPANIMVNIKVRFMRVEDSFLQDVGVDFRGLGNDSTSGEAGKGDDLVLNDFGQDFGSTGAPGTIGTGQDSGMIFREATDDVTIGGRTENLYDTALGADGDLTNSGGLSLQYTWLDDTQLEAILRAVKKSKRSELVIEPSLMVFNTARANLVVANQVSYVSDFDVEIASSAAIADPIVRVANDGVYLDVRPVVTADRRFVWIDVRPTVANLLRPIPTLQTSLGTGSPVTLMLPELELQKIRTRALVPDGGTLLLGGMRVAKEQEIESGVPFLNRIPVLSFFFSRKGTYENYQKLVILLTANIILPEEFEPAPLPAGF